MDRIYSGVEPIEGEGDRRKVGVIQELAKGGQVRFLLLSDTSPFQYMLRDRVAPIFRKLWSSKTTTETRYISLRCDPII